MPIPENDGCLLWAAVVVLTRHDAARTVALISGLVVLGWIGVQVAIIGYVSWMQPATAISAVLVLPLAWRLAQPRTTT